MRRQGFDIHALAFIAATGISDPVIQNAINYVVKSLKKAGIWYKYYAAYLIVGGNASTHRINLKNPSTFQSSFFGGWTHTETGALPDGTTGYADSGFNPSAHGLQDSAGISVYSRTDNSSGWDAGVYTVSSGAIFLLGSSISGNFYHIINSTNTPLVASGPSLGLFRVSRLDESTVLAIKNGQLLSSSPSASVPPPNGNAYFGGRNNITGFEPGSKELSWVSFDSGLTLEEAQAEYSIIQQFQTLLGRQV